MEHLSFTKKFDLEVNGVFSSRPDASGQYNKARLSHRTLCQSGPDAIMTRVCSKEHRTRPRAESDRYAERFQRVFFVTERIWSILSGRWPESGRYTERFQSMKSLTRHVRSVLIERVSESGQSC